VGQPEDQIRRFFERFASPPREEMDALIARGRRSLLSKGDFLVQLGDTHHRVAFLHTGIVRFHVVNQATGDDVTKDFVFAPGLVTSFGSAVRNQPARVAISAVEDCAVTLWPFEELRKQMDGRLEWEKFGRKVAEWLYVRKEDRELAFLLQSADERYDALSAEFPAAVSRIPQHLLASYLGVAPESLSRLKARRKSKTKRGRPPE
jgi:CRP-like cAMP-binding protein